MNKTNTYNEAAEAIKAANKILIASHSSPDADALGSSLALTQALIAEGKQVECINATENLASYSFLPAIDKVNCSLPSDSFDLVIICDCSNLSRTGDQYKTELSKFGPILNIDHHYASNDFFGELNLVEKEVSSTCEMIFNLLNICEFEITEDIAFLLMSGIYSDTVSLQRGIITSATYQALAELKPLVSDLDIFIDPLFWNQSLNNMKLKSKLVSDMELSFNDTYAEIIVDQATLDQYKIAPDEVHFLKDIALQIESVQVTSLIRPDNDIWRVSLRSRKSVDVNKIAQEIGGGGHAGAAGIKWKGDLEELRSKLNQLISAAIK